MKKKMKTNIRRLSKIGLLFWAVTLTGNVSGQQLTPEVLSSSGETYSGASTILNWNLGELSINTYDASGTILTQGFEQSDFTITTVEQKESTAVINVFPNPAISVITVQVPDNNAYRLELTDMSGKILLNATMLHTRDLDISTFESGFFILNVFDTNNTLTTKIKIVKNN